MMTRRMREIELLDNTIKAHRYYKEKELAARGYGGYHVMSKGEFRRRLMEDLGTNAKDGHDEAGICDGAARTVQPARDTAPRR